MTQKLINVGEGANSGTGDSIRDAFVKTNDNFNELYYNGATGIIEQRIQDFIGNLNTTSYISTTTMNVLAELLYVSTTTLTTRVGIVEKNVNTLTTTVTNLTTRVSNIETAAPGLVTVIALNTLTNTVTNLTTRVGNIEIAATALTSTVTTLTNTVTNLTTRVSNIETTATVLTSTVTNLTTRVGNIETAATTLTNTVTNLVSRMVTAEGHLVPTGVIMMWSGASTAIPTGYRICDGTNSTPDLRNRFVVGAGSTYAVAATGGSADAVVVDHSHTANSTDSGHTHTASTDADWSGDIPQINNNGGYVGGQSIHGGTVTVATGTAVITTTVYSTGTSATNANLPPYYALCYIMKT